MMKAPESISSAEGELLALLRQKLEELVRERSAATDRAGTSLSTSLVREAYRRLLPAERARRVSQRHFFTIAAMAMRQLRSEEAQRRRTGASDSTSISEANVETAFRHLGEFDETAYEIGMLRHYAGLRITDIARLMNMTESQVEAAWTLARAFLHRQISRRGDP